jgi:hypothetical protein
VNLLGWTCFSETVATKAPADDRVTVASRTILFFLRSWIVTAAGSSTSRSSDRVGGRPRSRRWSSEARPPIETEGDADEVAGEAAWLDRAGGFRMVGAEE